MWLRYSWVCEFSVPSAMTIHSTNGLRTIIIPSPLFSVRSGENGQRILVNQLSIIGTRVKSIIRSTKNHCLPNSLVGKRLRSKKEQIGDKSSLIGWPLPTIHFLPVIWPILSGLIFSVRELSNRSMMFEFPIPPPIPNYSIN